LNLTGGRREGLTKFLDRVVALTLFFSCYIKSNCFYWSLAWFEKF